MNAADVILKGCIRSRTPTNGRETGAASTPLAAPASAIGSGLPSMANASAIGSERRRHAGEAVPAARRPVPPVHDAGPAARVENLRLRYPGEDSPLLFKGLSLTIEHGQKVLLLGPSGCGKSTLLQVLGGLVPSAIRIPMKADCCLVPARPGYVFQDPDSQFCMPYADEEIAFALENAGISRGQMPDRISRCLDEVGLCLADPHFPVAGMSQGMKQRLAIAAMIAMEPDALLLDEPTALLDEEGTRQVWSSLRSVWGGRTVIIVEHKIAGIAEDMDRVIVFGPDGSIMADGSPRLVFREHRKLLREYGIWYPGFWEDYDHNAAIRPATMSPSPAARSAELLLGLDGLEGWRGGRPKVRTGPLAVNAGDWIAVTGVNGAGKSTLLLAIMKLVKTKGILHIPGIPVQSLKKPGDMAKHAALSFQNPEFQFVTDTVLDELAYSLPRPLREPERSSRARTLMENYALDGLGGRHPYQLSMGQKRRLSVAAAMVGGQRLLLLDEPTFGLDASGTVRMMEQLERLRSDGCAILMITHDPELVRRFATRQWLVDGGLVTERSGGTACI
ncbi:MULTISPECIES: ABC transporter ATP-binding protein [unclassified Paenibacillus]|uniref:ABC transporter ATP-binding protein n=1 Tax=unclassified Paenibacillus TaxID=185978 RepID=UPI0009554381|nr:MULTISPECIES: ABC transporter ATP-binding protein [unclassified Paenibacillus]SIR43042.1 energy-coupling factor transport system ATP-binding protein [Paenibacillus sp. RU4X]SIR53077.1 energy-coupling factor transport system ATP-binding protein [Paenibacillus sp. RU4T]